MYRIQSSSKGHLINLPRSQAEENTSYNSWSIFRNLRTTIFQTENKKACNNSKVNIQYFCNIDVSHTISSAF